MNREEQILESLGMSTDRKRQMRVNDWDCYSLNHNSPTREIPIIMVERGPKNIAELKGKVSHFDSCIVFFKERNLLYLKSPNESHTTVMDNDSDYHRISAILSLCNIAKANSEYTLTKAIRNAIVSIPDATEDFVNKGLFATHYLKSRMFDDVRHDVESDVPTINQKIGQMPEEILKILGWDVTLADGGAYYDGKVSITVTEQDDFSIRQKDPVAPSYAAVSKLDDSQWVILTNGKKWRLYSSRISASSTNYFEVTLDPACQSITRYLIAIFSSKSFEGVDGKADIDVFFEEGRNYATELEEDLSARIMNKDGLFLDIVKGVLDHDMKKIFSPEELVAAKQTALKIMYRVWFVAYAESRNLLPVNDSKYKPISLQSLKNRLDSYKEDPDNTGCWEHLLKLFEGIRKGSVKHNLPQYNGSLFKPEVSIDGISIRNKHIVSALRGLLERDGDAVDYANLSVRHLGNIFETLMEFSVRQTDKAIMLLEDKDGVREVKTRQQSTYSYRKNDLYLASKGGIASRKTTASFYTPDEIVKFLTKSGLEPIFRERELLLKEDLERYGKEPNDDNRKTCMDRLLDIQVLDPSMGSGHFLVEALNMITQWVTNMLDAHPDHPLLEEIESDRRTVLDVQKRKGITLDKSLLTHDILLKRKIMKRCIFGVDVNPMAVDLAKLSLWLDSFAIGVPLTYMDHHIKAGDSTIGMFFKDLKKKEMHTLDDWTPDAKSNNMIRDVISSSDITVDQVHKSEDKYREHQKLLEPAKRVLDALAASKIRPEILPKKSKDDFIHRFGRYSKTESDDLMKTRRTVDELAERYRFYHWELEMMDAFIDARRGFDLIVGNPPWELMKPYDDEFFTPHDSTFKSLKPNTKKKKRLEELCLNSNIKKEYEAYKNRFKDKNMFYKMYEMQGVGINDLWKLVLERTLSLVDKGGIISVVVPSQILSSTGAADMRKNLLEKEILSLYVFENRKKIFNIHSSYRFALLSVRNSEGPDKFPAGFYLHDLKSLENKNNEDKKFGTLSRQMLLKSDEYVISEITGTKLEIFQKISKYESLGDGLGDGWNLELSSGLNKTNDANLLLKNGKGWPVHEGKTIHQYNQRWADPDFTANERKGLKRQSTKRVFAGKHRDFYNSFRLVFRNTTRSTDMRTCIGTIIPPHTFHTYSLRSIILTQNDRIVLDAQYDRKISYLCGILNSLVFDFAARAKVQVDLSTIIRSLPIPRPDHEARITELAAKLVVGTPEFEGFAESLRVPNTQATPSERIHLAAELDALVALSYGLTLDEYKTVIDSFPAFKKNPSLYDMKDIVWDNKNLKEFYGEMADCALQYFEELGK